MADDVRDGGARGRPPSVRLQTPPPAVLRVVNPVVRRLLGSPLSGALPSAMALLEFTGRRSGRPFAVPVGAHELTVGTVVFTEAAWRRNFEGGRAVALRRGGRRRDGHGVLVTDADAVADALHEAVERYGPGTVAVRAARGHRITRDDVRRLGRGMVCLDLAAPPAPPQI